jgi:hypothetical protein
MSACDPKRSFPNPSNTPVRAADALPKQGMGMAPRVHCAVVGATAFHSEHVHKIKQTQINMIRWVKVATLQASRR